MNHGDSKLLPAGVVSKRRFGFSSAQHLSLTVGNDVSGKFKARRRKMIHGYPRATGSRFTSVMMYLSIKDYHPFSFQFRSGRRSLLG